MSSVQTRRASEISLGHRIVLEEFETDENGERTYEDFEYTVIRPPRIEKDGFGHIDHWITIGNERGVFVDEIVFEDDDYIRVVVS